MAKAPVKATSFVSSVQTSHGGHSFGGHSFGGHSIGGHSHGHAASSYVAPSHHHKSAKGHKTHFRVHSSGHHAKAAPAITSSYGAPPTSTYGVPAPQKSAPVFKAGPKPRPTYGVPSVGVSSVSGPAVTFSHDSDSIEIVGPTIRHGGSSISQSHSTSTNLVVVREQSGSQEGLAFSSPVQGAIPSQQLPLSFSRDDLEIEVGGAAAGPAVSVEFGTTPSAQGFSLGSIETEGFGASGGFAGVRLSSIETDGFAQTAAPASSQGGFGVTDLSSQAFGVSDVSAQGLGAAGPGFSLDSIEVVTPPVFSSGGFQAGAPGGARAQAAGPGGFQAGGLQAGGFPAGLEGISLDSIEISSQIPGAPGFSLGSIELGTPSTRDFGVQSVSLESVEGFGRGVDFPSTESVETGFESVEIATSAFGKK